MKCLLNKNPISIGKHLIKTLTTFPIPMGDSTEIKKPKYDGRSKKRQWQDRRSDNSAKLLKIDATSTSTQPLPDKIKRRKYAILMGYSGVDYYGMQRNPNTKTIEEELFKTLFDCDFIDQLCYDQVQNMQFQRAARTDKGVSAARQVVSLKLKETFNIEAVNEKLSSQIRLFASKRVTKGFNSKTQCDGRTYIYVTPSVVFSDQQDLPQQKGFRISQQLLDKINETLALYVGTKSFHNFTIKKKYGDPSAKRFIKAFTCEPTFIENDVEFCTLKVHGQSFMMHQIRKMVGLVLAVMRGQATLEVVAKAIGEDKVNIPRAPGLGLLLNYVHYDRYNFKYGSDGMHETLTWEEVDQQVEEFKHRQILPTIINTEIAEEQMVWWVKNKLARHSFDDEESDDEQ
ncbi:unnamed protein product [Ceutorhynchus assimilis]|uniref:Pseudouridylate synthase 1 homolog n=1 Tax=Ceutorhynchus assimilis TaxID=467358 RepID=A0A9N9MI98_9CUCU|nr:unnamed protein product [Ceutorhynchus assimilis]